MARGKFGQSMPDLVIDRAFGFLPAGNMEYRDSGKQGDIGNMNQLVPVTEENTGINAIGWDVACQFLKQSPAVEGNIPGATGVRDVIDLQIRHITVLPDFLNSVAEL